jgi:hypothetical protein
VSHVFAIRQLICVLLNFVIVEAKDRGVLMLASFRRFITVGAVGAAAIALVATPVAQAEPEAKPDPLAAIESTEAALPTDILGLIETANEQMSELGIDPFLWPTAALNCSQVPGTPLGLVPAVAGAAPGPTTPPIGDLSLPNPLDPDNPFDLNAVKRGEVLYGFVPAGIVNDSGDKSGMNVAWFNVDTFKGGFVPMGSLTSAVLNPIKSQIAELPVLLRPVANALIAPLEIALEALPQAGTRAAIVKTGSGTVLSLVLGSVTHSSGTCYFLPTLGIQDVG